MKKYYAGVAAYASDEDKNRLAEGIDPSQRGNESQFDDGSRYTVSLKKVNSNADIIGASLHN
ncbi:MAG TPA: hypothetical protein VFV23_05220 [Verrucomicrobiae bacterium]|nr:hypothetical protein [Verrucomicrobiae bacterium]